MQAITQNQGAPTKPYSILIPKTKIKRFPIGFAQFLDAARSRFGGCTLQGEMRGSWLETSSGITHDDSSLVVSVSIPANGVSLAALNVIVADAAQSLKKLCLFVSAHSVYIVVLLLLTAPMFGAIASIKDLAVDREKQAFVTDTLTRMGLSNDVTVVIDPKAPGCAWAGLVDGKQVIGIDPACVGPLRNGQSYEPFCLFVLGHELGHLLHRHDRSSNPPEESQADEFAGWLMARMGSTLEEARASARRMDESGGKTHPPRYARVIAVELGWTRGQAFHIPGQANTPLPIPIPAPAPVIAKHPEPSPAPPVITAPPKSEPPSRSPLEVELPPVVLTGLALIAITITTLFIASAWSA